MLLLQFSESVIIIMCWAHVRRNVVKQLHLVDEMYREDVMVDIDKLQLASNKEVFNIAKDLFINGTLKNKLHSLII
jgi:hypothetical protein